MFPNTPAIGRSALLVGLLLALLAACGGATDSTNVQAPGASPAAAIDGSTAAPGATAAPGTTSAPATPDPNATPRPTLPRVPALQPPAFASRVIVADYGIDLPVVSGDLQPPPNYPYCDVAAYVTRFGQPYETGLTYISAHAQRGMFLPLLEASERNDGAEMIGKVVDVYVSDGRVFTYRISRVIRHATDYAVVAELDLGQRTLILQTSEGPYGTLEKLQVVADFESETTTDAANANPDAEPRDCEPDATSAPASTQP